MKSVKREEPASRLFVSLIIGGVILASLPCYVNNGTNVYYGNYRNFAGSSNLALGHPGHRRSATRRQPLPRRLVYPSLEMRMNLGLPGP